jgi:hypothetical protein
LDLFPMNSKPAAAAILLLTASVQFGQLNWGLGCQMIYF